MVYLGCQHAIKMVVMWYGRGYPCRCQNRRISGRGSRSVRLRQMVTGDKEHDVFTQVRALSMEVKPYSCLINIDDMGSTRVDLPRDQRG